MQKTGIYAIYDTLAKDIVGGLHLHKHEATAVRFFADVAELPNSAIARHPQDHNLIRIGWVGTDEADEPTVVDDYKVILSGATWAAANTPPKE